MSTPTITRVSNTPRDYAWGQVGGISRALGWAPSAAKEAELWLGAHPLSPSRTLGPGAPWPDLATWERATGSSLPYLMKLLAAAQPLSLQAHPTQTQAAEGFAREEEAGIPRTDPARNYKDPHAKPELIVAVEDGFQALCGFAPVATSVAVIDAVRARSADPSLSVWRALVADSQDLRTAVAWLLSGDPQIEDLTAALTTAAAREPEQFPLIHLLAATFPGDPGIAVALLLDHVTLAAGEALWLPAGNIHAYLSGLGVELMGPSDNVLRGGLTPKHVDVTELMRVLDFTSGAPPRLTPVPIAPNAAAYRPSSLPSGKGVGFELLRVTGNVLVEPQSAATVLVVAGEFALNRPGASATLTRGEAAFIDRPGPLSIAGGGELYLATGR